MVTERTENQPEKRHEESDADVRALLRFAIWMFVSLALVMVLMRWMFWFFAETQQLGAPATPFESTRALPPAPRLQTEPQQDLRAYRGSQQDALSEFGWVDRKSGVVRIPIDRAMDLLLQQGLPVRGERLPRSVGVIDYQAPGGAAEKKN